MIRNHYQFCFTFIDKPFAILIVRPLELAVSVGRLDSGLILSRLIKRVQPNLSWSNGPRGIEPVSRLFPSPVSTVSSFALISKRRSRSPLNASWKSDTFLVSESKWKAGSLPCFLCMQPLRPLAGVSFEWTQTSYLDNCVAQFGFALTAAWLIEPKRNDLGFWHQLTVSHYKPSCRNRYPPMPLIDKHRYSMGNSLPVQLRVINWDWLRSRFNYKHQDVARLGNFSLG